MSYICEGVLTSLWPTTFWGSNQMIEGRPWLPKQWTCLTRIKLLLGWKSLTCTIIKTYRNKLKDGLTCSFHYPCSILCFDCGRGCYCSNFRYWFNQIGLEMEAEALLHTGWWHWDVIVVRVLPSPYNSPEKKRVLSYW